MHLLLLSPSLTFPLLLHSSILSLSLSLPLCLSLSLPPSLWGEEAGWISAGVREMLAVNNRGIINRSLHSNYECCTLVHTHTHTHTHTHREKKCTHTHTHIHTKKSNQSAKLPYLLHMKMELQKLAHLFWTIRVIEVWQWKFSVHWGVRSATIAGSQLSARSI